MPRLRVLFSYADPHHHPLESKANLKTHQANTDRGDDYPHPHSPANPDEHSQAHTLRNGLAPTDPDPRARTALDSLTRAD